MWTATEGGRIVNLNAANWVGWAVIDHPAKSGVKDQALVAKFAGEDKPHVIVRYDADKGEKPSIDAMLRPFVDQLKAQGEYIDRADFNCMSK